MKWILTLIFVIIIAPQWLVAGNFIEKNRGIEETWKKVNQDVDKTSKEIKYVTFGIAIKIIGMLAVAYGVISAILTASPRPIMTVGGLGFLVAIIPNFVDTVFGATLPL